MLDRGTRLAAARRRRPTRAGGARSATRAGRSSRATCAAGSPSGCSPTAACMTRSTRSRRGGSSSAARAAQVRGRRDLPAQLLRQPGARAAAARARRGRCSARRPGLDLLGDLAAREGVRARVDDGRRRVHEAASSPATRTSSTRTCASSGFDRRAQLRRLRRDAAARGAEALEQPFRIVFAGPAAGTISSTRLGEAIGDGNLLCCDVGGTSTDVSLVVDGAAVRQQHVRARARPDHQRALDARSRASAPAAAASSRSRRRATSRSGPAARAPCPGPACYGRGGTAADAHGRVPADGHPRPGRVRRRRDAARRRARAASVRGASTRRFGSSSGSAYAYRIAVANIAEEVTNVAVRHGVDPRDFTLVAYGAAGPMLLPAGARPAAGRGASSSRRTPGCSRRSGCSAPTSSTTTAAAPT